MEAGVDQVEVMDQVLPVVLDMAAMAVLMGEVEVVILATLSVLPQQAAAAEVWLTQTIEQSYPVLRIPL
jgi:hypothetical protein